MHAGNAVPSVVGMRLYAAVVVALIACAEAPVTHRKEFIAVSAADEDQLGAQAFDQVKAQNKVSTDPAITGLVLRVTQRLANAAAEVAPDTVRGFKWQVMVIDDP